jgi:hypothetical protein
MLREELVHVQQERSLSSQKRSSNFKSAKSRDFSHSGFSRSQHQAPPRYMEQSRTQLQIQKKSVDSAIQDRGYSLNMFEI